MLDQRDISSTDLANHWLNLDLSDRSPAYFNALQKALAPLALSNQDRWKLRSQILSSRRKAFRGTGTKHTHLLQKNEAELRSDLDVSTSAINIIQRFREAPLYKSENKHLREADASLSTLEVDISPTIHSPITSSSEEESNLPYNQFTWNNPSLCSLVWLRKTLLSLIVLPSIPSAS